MRYMLMIYFNEPATAAMTQTEAAANMQAWFTFTDDLGQSGKMLGGDALQPSATATTVRAGADDTLVSDGPFAETKEQLGGYYVVEAADLDEAIAWAKRMPAYGLGGAVEIRPIMEFDQSA